MTGRASSPPSPEALASARALQEGVGHARSGRLARAMASFQNAIELDHHNYSAHFNLALAFDRSGDLRTAARQFGLMAERFEDPSLKTRALNQAARVLDGLREYDKAHAALRQSLEIQPHQPDALQDIVHIRQAGCIWPVIEPFGPVTSEALVNAMEPLGLLAHSDDPALQLALNARYAIRPGTQEFGVRVGSMRSGDRLRIGYLSADFRDHATGHLMRDVPALHDRTKVEVTSYYSGPKVLDALQEHFRSCSDMFVDVSKLDDDAASRRIAQDGIDILIDLNVHTRHRRGGIVARRPAPIIVNWLGFPGTSGSPYHHYILADEWTIPPGEEKYFSERVMRLPCYQPNPRQRRTANTRQRRADAGLPDRGFVFCCFNGLWKITPASFARWMQILQAVEESVLWLLSGPAELQKRLEREAEACGVSASRLVFADWKRNDEHLARYQLADLFLDTEPYGAHTTAADALWMGVPVVTISGRSFASRVCGSLVRSAGLPDLVFTEPQDFVAEAIAIAGSRERLDGYRGRLAAARDSCVLFNPAHLVRHLESLYEEMWRHLVVGELPQPDLNVLVASR